MQLILILPKKCGSEEMGGRVGDGEGEGRIKDDFQVLGLGHHVGGGPIHWERTHKMKNNTVERGDMFGLGHGKPEGVVVSHADR